MRSPATTSPDERRAQEIRALEARLSRFGRTRALFRKWMRVCSWVALVQMAAAAKRTVDCTLALVFLVLLSPALAAGSLMALSGSGRLLEKRRCAGRFMAPFDLLHFADFGASRAGRLARALQLGRLPALWNIVRGDMSFVGPRCVAPSELDATQRSMRKRLAERPGLVCLWWLRKRGNVDYGSEWEVDGEYVERRSFLGDFGIALRTVPALLLGGAVETAPDEIRLLGLRIDNLLMDEAVELLVRRMAEEHETRLCFVNADCANIASLNRDYRSCVCSADLVLADGIGMKMAGKILRREVRQNVNGTDLFPALMESMHRERRSVYFLGARPGVARDVAAYVASSYPGVRVAGFHHGYYEPDEEPAVLAEIRSARPDCLLVAFGAPRQDLWLDAKQSDTGATVAMGVGGLFDFYSGRIPRAPQWMREVGMEWIYRFIQEPRRMWRRYFVGNGVFLWRVMCEALGSQNSKNGRWT